MKSVLGWTVICLFGAFFLGNGLLMAASPRVWFRLPTWIGVHGRFTKEKYSSGPVSIGVRLLGAVFVAVVSWVVYDVLSRR